MLCPYCQEIVEAFEPAQDGTSSLACPVCHEPGVPTLYPMDYDLHPGVPVSVFGPSGHGKTVFVEALLNELERNVRWPAFSTQWMDPAAMREMRQRLLLLRQHSQLPDASRVVFPRPQVLRLRGIPAVGGCQLLLYDTGGETFGDELLLRDVGRYVRNSKTVLWLVSLDDLEYPEQLTDLMTVYAAAMTGMGANPRDQSVIVVLTKGDLILDRPGLPSDARKFLHDDRLDPSTDAWQRLSTLSKALEAWLLNSDQRNLVNVLKSQFRQVRFCIISAQGAPAHDQQLQLKLAPRGVLAPLLWVWFETLPIAWLESPDGVTRPFFSLMEAVNAAPSGATIRLTAPLYTLPSKLIVSRQLAFVGCGADQVILRCEASDCVVVIDAPRAEVSFSGITLVRSGTTPGDVVRVTRGMGFFLNCIVRGAVAAPQNYGDGISVLGDAVVSLRGCILEFNQGNGIAVRGRARGQIVRSSSSHNQKNGILVDGGEANLNEVHADRNGREGVRLDGSARAALHHSTCNQNTKAGVLVSDQASIEVQSNECSRNGSHGIAARDESRVGLHENRLVGNGGAGIVLVGRASGIIAGNRCEENAKYGIAVEEAATGEISGNTCIRNLGSGIGFAGESSGTCEENRCDANHLSGIRVVGQAAPSLDGNICNLNEKCGFRIESTAKLAFGTKKRNEAQNNSVADYHPEKRGRRGWFK